MTTQSPVLVARGEGEHFGFLSSIHTAKINSEQTNDRFQAMEFYAPRNFAAPLHRHEREDELFYVLAGELWFTCGDVEAVHGQGAVVYLPRGLAHTFQVRSETARVFLVSMPAGFERFVATLGRPADSELLPEPEEVDPDRMAEVCQQFSIEVLGPPPAPVG